MLKLKKKKTIYEQREKVCIYIKYIVQNVRNDPNLLSSLTFQRYHQMESGFALKASGVTEYASSCLSI